MIEQDPAKKFTSIRGELPPELKEEADLSCSIIERLPDSVIYDPDNHSREFKKMAQVYEEERICCASQREQIAQFGVSEWKEHYCRLAVAFPEHYDELLDYGAVLQADRKRIQLVKSLICDRSVSMEMFQSLFSDNREIVFKTDGEYNPERDVQASLVSPRFIPDKLLEDLHLADFSDCKGMARLERKADLVTINALKAIFAKMRPLKGGREFILQEVHPESNAFGVNGEELEQRLIEYNRYCPGSIIVVSEDKIEKFLEDCDGGLDFRHCKASFFSDANSRIRAGYYTQGSYAVERDQLAEHIQDIIGIGELLQGWKRDTEPEIKGKISDDVVKFVRDLKESLDLARNKYKIDVARICKMIEERPDMQKNPSACLMVLSQAVREFEACLKESNYKDGAKLRDVNNVSILASRARSSFSTLEKRLQDYKEDYKNGVKTSFNFVKFKAAVNALKQIEIAPYNSFAKAVIGQLGMLENNAAGANNAIKRIEFVINLYKVNEALDGLLQGNYGPEGWKKKLDGVYQLFRDAVEGVEKGIPIITINVHEKISELDKRLTEVKQRCAVIAQGDGVDMIKKYRECLKTAKHVAGMLDIARAMIY